MTSSSPRFLARSLPTLLLAVLLPVALSGEIAPQIEEVKPAAAAPGDEVSIYLIDPLTARVQDVVVQFGDRDARVVHRESRVIDVEVPQGLAVGSYPPITVYVDKQATRSFDRFQVADAKQIDRPAPIQDTAGEQPADQPAGRWTDSLLPIAGSLIGLLALIGWLRARTRLKALQQRQAEPRAAPEPVPPVRTAVTAPQPASQPKPEAEPFTLPPPEPPQELIATCIGGECVLYAGAGLSARAGLPVWEPLVGSMIDWASNQGTIDNTQAAKLRIALRDGSADEVAGIVLAQIGSNRPRLQDYLRQIFANPELQPSAEHQLLQRIRFGAALTTNYDDLLEATFADRQPERLTPEQADDLLAALTRQRFFIAKLYGRLDSDRGVLVAPSEYSDQAAANATFGKFMETLFLSRTLLFLGVSLDGLEDYAASIRVQRYGDHKHFALVAVRDEHWEIKAQTLERRYGIQVVPYTANDDFDGFRTFVKKLEQRVAGAEKEGESLEDAGASAGPGMVTGKRSAVKRIHLENIGPFDELTVDLDPYWNILLGDNGVGKSTVLKALAIAYCGADAAPFAGRVITEGKNNARIVVETERSTYFTDLAQRSDGAEVVSKPNRLLEMEGSLAIAFPPIRTLSWQRPRGPSKDDRNRLSPEDLMPLVRGEPDPRLDQLKQWFINLDYRMKSGESRMGAILEDFNRVIDRIAVGVTMRVGEIDTRTYEISMITDDGSVALEKVSQGTASLIGWTGILLQRYYEVFVDDEDPKQRYALVMIDEIDAHMHPEWQQSLVPALSEVFPSAQFLATTHSPLIVGGMDTRQILRFARGADGHPQVMPVDEDMTMGRADQILTSSLFGLESTLDKTTQERIVNYQRLLGKSKPTEAERAELKRLQQELNDRIPVPREGPIERRAEELLEALLKNQVGGDHPETQQALLAKARRLFEALGGNGGTKS